MSVLDLPVSAELEADKPKSWWDRLRTLGLAVRIGTLIAQPLPDETLPPPPPPKVEVVSPTDRDPRRRRRGPESELGDRSQFHLMQRLGRLAATTPNEAEAEAFVGALPTLAAMLAPGAASALLASAPRLARGLSDATRVLRAHPATRPMVATLPAATRNAALHLQQQVRHGRPITPDTCARTLAQETMRALHRAAARS